VSEALFPMIACYPPSPGLRAQEPYGVDLVECATFHAARNFQI
jgi:hypothetical protein